MGKGKTLNAEEQANIEAGVELNLSISEISRQISRSRKVVLNFIQKKSGYGKNNKGGNNRVLTDADRLKILREASNSYDSTPKIRAKTGIKASLSTIQRVIRNTPNLQRPKLCRNTDIKDTSQRLNSSLFNKERYLMHQFDGDDLNVYDNKIINLAVGAPGKDLLQNCDDMLVKATEHRLKIDRDLKSSTLFQYGPESGTYEARSAIAKYFSEAYGSEVRGEDVFITTGATQGLHMVLSTLVDFNGYVFIDELSYIYAMKTIEQFTTMKIIPLKLTDDGVDLVQFESYLLGKRFKPRRKEFWAMYYAMPVFHNPTGVVFSRAVCKDLIRLARKYDFLITCDDVYNLLHYTGEKPPQRLLAYDDRNDDDFVGHVISNVSFSKIISPGLRLGWMEMPRRMKILMEESGVAGGSGCLNNYTSGIVASLFELGLAQEHIKTLHAAYKERMLATCAVLEQELPPGCGMRTPTGGYFIWVYLPEKCNAVDFKRMCLEEEKINFIDGPEFTVMPEVAFHNLRLSIAFYSKEILQDAARRFCQALKRYLEMKKLE